MGYARNQYQYPLMVHNQSSHLSEKTIYLSPCLTNSAYDQKPQVGMRTSNPPTPSSTPVSPLHHASSNSVQSSKPDRIFQTHLPPSQPIPDNSFPMDHR